MWFLIIFINVLSFPHPIAANTLRPIIGVVAQELSYSMNEKYSQHSSYIAASYVKAVESAGAQVVPIAINQSELYYRNMLRSINGVVFPGGGTNNGPGNFYYDTVKKIYKIALELNQDNIFFPLLGVCLGYEFLITIANSDENNILTRCNVLGENLALKFTQPYEKTNFFTTLSQKQYELLSTKNVTTNWHRWCVTKDNFDKQPLLRNWIITSLSTSSENKEFIASVEHNKYPIFGIQFHPEKTSFEWKKNRFYDHSEEAYIANKFFYERLVHFARQNNQKFDDDDIEEGAFIYNYPITYTAKYTSFTQIYFDPYPANAVHSQKRRNRHFSLH